VAAGFFLNFSGKKRKKRGSLVPHNNAASVAVMAIGRQKAEAVLLRWEASLNKNKRKRIT
jgi:hypothetical protein